MWTSGRNHRSPPSPTAAFTWDAALVALVAFLPFIRGVLAGRSFYLRDLSRYFFPLRRFAVEGLLQGHVRYWNPYVHGGEAIALPPISYPFDLLQMLVRDEHGLSLLLALHVSLAAVAFRRLAREWGLSAPAACGAAIVYALGGFCLSCLDLYVFLQAVAWAPLVVLGLLRAARGGAREVALAAVLIAVAISTTAVEVVAQALLLGLVLSAHPTKPARWLRHAAAIALALGLASATILFMRGLAHGSSRALGFPPEVSLSFSVHPISFGQVLIGDLHGDLHDLVNSFWAGRVGRYPYVASLYLGAAAFALAILGARFGTTGRRRLVVMALAAAFICLGSWGGLSVLLEALPFLRMFRFPVKAFFTVHFCAALLVGLGLHALTARAGPLVWRWLAILGLGLGAVVAGTPAALSTIPAVRAWFQASFFSEGYPAALQALALRSIAEDAAFGGLAAVAVGLLALLAARGRLSAASVVMASIALIAADLLRAGAGLNPMVSPSFYELSPAMSRLAAELSAQGARLFTCEPEFSPAFQPAAHVAQMARRGHEIWSLAVYKEALTPYYDLSERVQTAYSRDLTALTPADRVFSGDEIGCLSFSAIAPRLREAGVTHVLSVSPLDDPQLESLREIASPRISPLALHLYALQSPVPLKELGPGAIGRIVTTDERPGRMDLLVTADRPTTAVVRQACDAGWSSTVNGAPTPLSCSPGGPLAVAVEAGASRVGLTYAPPHLALGLLLTALSGAVILALAARSRAFGVNP